MTRSRTSFAVAALAVISMGPRAARAQSPDLRAVQPERPTVATHAGTVAPGFLEMEIGVEWDRQDQRSAGDIAPILAKVGVSSHTQLNISSLVVWPVNRSTGMGDLTLGLKWRLTDGAPVLGRFAVLPSLKLSVGSLAEGTSTDTTDVGLLLISSHDLGPVALDLNAGYVHRSGDHENIPEHATSWTASFGGPAFRAIGWVAELFGYPRTHGRAGQESIVALLVGPTFDVRSWLSLDVGAIVPLTGPQPDAFYVGGVWNVGRLYR